MTTTSASSPAHAKYPLHVRLRKGTAKLFRWLHIYLSMISFAVIFFFAVTGLTLNHAEWFDGHEQTTNDSGTLPAGIAHANPPDKLAIVEYFRNTHKIHGAVTDFRIDDSQIEVDFKGPGYTADGVIDPATGHYDILETRNGAIAVLNDLHKGRDTGPVWSAVVDVSAILLTLVSLTGLVLIWFVYKRRTSGLILAAIAAIVCWALYRLYVP